MSPKTPHEDSAGASFLTGNSSNEGILFRSMFFIQQSQYTQTALKRVHAASAAFLSHLNNATEGRAYRPPEEVRFTGNLWISKCLAMR